MAHRSGHPLFKTGRTPAGHVVINTKTNVHVAGPFPNAIDAIKRAKDLFNERPTKVNLKK